MKRTYKTTLLTILTLSMMSGCDSKTEKNIQASIEAIETHETSQDTKNINITHNTKTEIKKANYKTVAYYTKHAEERMKKYKECESGEVSNYQNDKECDNALEAIQLEKRKNASAFIHQDFMKK